MRRISMALAIVVFGGLIAFRVFNWGSDVKGYIDAQHHDEMVHISNVIVRPLNEATKSVDAQHSLLRRAADPMEKKRKGLIMLLGLSGDVVSDGVAEARKSVRGAELPSNPDVDELIKSANALLQTYEGFIPVHAELSQKILSAPELNAELTQAVRKTLADLETRKSESIKAFSRAQNKFLR